MRDSPATRTKHKHAPWDSPFGHPSHSALSWSAQAPRPASKPTAPWSPLASSVQCRARPGQRVPLPSGAISIRCLSVVGHFREVAAAAALGREVEQAPNRVDQVERAVILARIVGGEYQLAAPEVVDGPAVLAEHVEHRLVPVVA